MRHVSSYKRQTRPTGGSAIHKDATASISPTIPYTVGCCMESTLVRTGFTPWKALRSGPSHRQRQTVSLCEQLNVHACAADRLSISFHSRRSRLSWADMWWTSMPGQGWHHGASTLSMRLHGPLLTCTYATSSNNECNPGSQPQLYISRYFPSRDQST